MLMNLNWLFATICVEGKDAFNFLQGFCTTHVHELDQKSPQKTLFCNTKGRIIASGILFYESNEKIHIVTEHSVAAKLMEHLNRFKLLSNVTLSISNEAMAYATDPAPTSCAITPSHSIGLSFDPTEKNSTKEEQNTWIETLVQAKFPLISAQTSELFTPHQLVLEAAWVNFKKGCYLGQEIIARMHHLGKTKQSTKLIPRINTKPGGHCIDSNKKVVGRVLYSSLSSTLVVIDKEQLEKNDIIGDDDIL